MTLRSSAALLATSSSALSVFKYLLLVLLWIFFILVARSVLVELRRAGLSEQDARARPSTFVSRLAGAPRPTANPRPTARAAAPMPNPRPTARAAPPISTADPRLTATPQVRTGPSWAPDNRPGGSPGPPAPATQAIGGLVLLEGGTRPGRRVSLAQEMTVGRSTACDLALAEDSFVSGSHARLWRQGDQVWIEDLGSTNGTFLNERRLAGAGLLHAGDRLQMGRTVLEVRP